MRGLTLLLLALPLLAAGCQSAVAPVEDWRASAEVARTAAATRPAPLLAPAAEIEPVAATVAWPVGWDQRPLQTRPFAKHQQYRSPDESVRVGVVKFALPWPVSAETLVWLANRRYQASRKDAGNKYQLSDTRRDDLGRLWLTGTSRDWRATGYLVTKGFNAWLVYRSQRTDVDPPAGDLRKAEDAVEAVVPDL